MNPIFTILESSLYGVVGDFTLLAIILFIVFFFILVWRGMDFRYALMVITPAVAKLAGTWLPMWFGFMLWFFVVGFGLYLAWKAVTPSY